MHKANIYALCSMRTQHRLLALLVFLYVVLRFPFVPQEQHILGNEEHPFLCIMLTLDNTSHAHDGCEVFLGWRFQADDLALVSTDARRKLLHTELQETSRELSNNASVSIFLNHMRIWQRVAAADGPVLVLEDDAVLPKDMHKTLQLVLEQLRSNNISNYVVKLHELKSLFVYAEWSEVFKAGRYSVKSCRCKPHGSSASTSAYLLDRNAAQKLLLAALPLRIHLDMFLHNAGCVQRLTQLYSVQPSPVQTSWRPSTHMQTFTLQRLRLLAVELFQDWQAGECPESERLVDDGPSVRVA